MAPPRRRTALTLLLMVAMAIVTVACGEDAPLTPTAPRVEAPEPGDAPAEDAADAERRIERAVFELVNDERRERGLQALQWDDQLADLARQWSMRMAEEGRLRHQDAERMLERSEGFTGVGENIFQATGPVPASTIHVGWMRSDGHRANVLRPAFDRIGVGVVCTEDGAVWATQRFGRTAGSGSGEPSDEIPPQEPIVAAEGEGPSCPGDPRPVEIQLDR